MSSRPSIDKYYIQMLKLVGSRGTCARRQVAAIIIDCKGRLIATGYNGVPSGMPHCIDYPCEGARDSSGDNSRCIAIHAEQNAIMQAGSRLKEATTIYCSTTPCFNCSKLIISSGIKNVIATSIYPDLQGIRLMLKSESVEIFVYDEQLDRCRNLPQEIIDQALR